MKIPYTTEVKISKVIKSSKNFFLFGYNSVAKQTIQKYKKSTFKKIFDNSKKVWGFQFHGIEIVNPSIIKKLKKFVIIICSTSYVDICKQLENYGLKPEINFFVSPYLNHLKKINEIESIQKKILFACGNKPQKNPKYGGGLYLLTINKSNWKYKKIYSGNCHGLLKVKKNYYLVDDYAGIIKFSQKFKKLKIIYIENNLRPHGLSYDDKFKKFYLSCTNKDLVKVYNKNFILEKNIFISKKILKNKVKNHHVNDCLIIKNKLYVSMFSLSGKNSIDLFDGGVIEINLRTNKKKVIFKDLIMPHSIHFFNKRLHILDSFKGRILIDDGSHISNLPGFVRGLDLDDDNYYIGQSRNRNYYKLKTNDRNVSLDTGILILNIKNKLTRFIQLDPRLNEIHSLKIVK
tara:strand:+ start:104 stop:1312 length:1209 start_codon:yes stop_codon:yes gene_type:complete